jgi:hypothetical protein
VALQANVDAVIAAIRTVYSTCDGKPKQGDIVAASGLSRSTYARVMREHAEARQALDLADAVLSRRLANSDDADSLADPDGDDPIKRNPLQAVEELLAAIDLLALVNEAQKRRIQALEDQLTLRPLDF